MLFSLGLNGFSAFGQTNASYSEYSFKTTENSDFRFRENKGQWNEAILYSGDFFNKRVSFLEDGLVVSSVRQVIDSNKDFSIPHRHRPEEFAAIKEQHLVWKLNFLNINEDCQLISENGIPSKAYYLYHDHIDASQDNIYDYSKLIYKNLYEGIDLHYYVDPMRGLKYDLIIHPFANLEEVQFSYEGIENLQILNNGDIRVVTAFGNLIEDAPISFQWINGQQKKVGIKYRLVNDSTYGFQIFENYIPSDLLVVDPFTLGWSTFIGGATPADGYSYDIALDADGQPHITGYYNAYYPVTPTAFDTSFGGITDAYVTKLSRNGDSVLYSTYLGGTGREEGEGIDIDFAGNAVVIGQTTSMDFPTTPGAFSRTKGIGDYEIFITKLNTTGTAAIFSTFVGGTSSEYGEDLYVDDTGSILFTGTTFSGDFPISAGAFDTLSVNSDAYFARLSSDGSQLLGCSFYGNDWNEYAYGIVADSEGKPVIIGITTGTDLTIPIDAFDTSSKGGDEIFIASLTADFTSLEYATYFGTNSNDLGNAIATDKNDNIYITGQVQGKDMPITDGVYQEIGFGYDIFVSKFNRELDSIIYSTYVGGTSTEEAFGITLNQAGEVFISGKTYYSGFPVSDSAFQSTSGGGQDMVIVHLNRFGTAFGDGGSTYLGGRANDYSKCAIDFYENSCQASFVVNGTSHSDDFPTTPGTVQPTKLNGPDDQPVVVKFEMENYTWPPPLRMDTSICEGDSLLIQAHEDRYVSWLWSTGDTAKSIYVKDTGWFALYITDTCGSNVDSFYLDFVSDVAGPIMQRDTVCDQDSFILTRIDPSAQNYLWSTGESDTSIVVWSTGWYILLRSNACYSAIDSFYVIIHKRADDLLFLDSLICKGDSVFIDGSGPNILKWNWSTGDTTYFTYLKDSGLHYLTYTDVCGSETDTTDISFYPGLLPAIVHEDTVCDGDSVLWLRNDPLTDTYLWSTGIADSFIYVKDAGKYYLDRSNHCYDAADTFNLLVDFEQSGLLPNDSLICDQPSFLIEPNLSGRVDLTWQDNSHGLNYNVTSTGWYILTAENKCGVFVDSVHLELLNSPLVTMPGDSLICEGEAILLSADPSMGFVEWSHIAMDNQLVVNETGNYWIRITNDCGSDYKTAHIVFENCCRPTIPNAFSPDGDGLNDEFLLIPTECYIENVDLKVFNRYGPTSFSITRIGKGLGW